MAIKLENKTNVEAPDVNYPYGRIKDETTPGTGTPVNVQVYGDFHQFFAKLLAEGGVTANNLPDNATNGFQYFLALRNLFAEIIPYDSTGSWIDGGPLIVAGSSGGTASLFSQTYNKYKVIGKTLFWQANMAITVDSGSPNVVSVDFPVAITPSGLTGNPVKLVCTYGTGLVIGSLGATTISFSRTPVASFGGSGINLNINAVFEIN
jgi:hypothetical protein